MYNKHIFYSYWSFYHHRCGRKYRYKRNWSNASNYLCFYWHCYHSYWRTHQQWSKREGNEIKTKIAIILCTLLCFTGCTQREREIEHTTYITSGRYYTCGEIITDDGNVWSYSQDTISERESYDNQPIFALIDDNGTPREIHDDIVYGLVFDRETAIYDALETSLSESFTLERNGNVISVKRK